MVVTIEGKRLISKLGKCIFLLSAQAEHFCFHFSSGKSVTVMHILEGFIFSVFMPFVRGHRQYALDSKH